MKVLVTSSRLPFAVEEIRKLGEEGHVVYAADTFARAPGNHSRHVASYFTVPSPRLNSSHFVERVVSIVEQNQIEVVVPAFEEAFYLSRHAEELPERCRLFAPEWPEPLRLHRKSSFLELAAELGQPTCTTWFVDDEAKMRERMNELGDYFARPVNSRGATELLTNQDITRGKKSLSECEVSDRHPWIIQPYVAGPELCTYSIARQGELLAHVTYRHPLTLGDRGGVAFESVDSGATLAMAQALARATNYTGQFGLDLIDSETGLVLSECNPRGTAGVALLPADVFARAVAGFETSQPYVAPAGHRRKITTGLLLDAVQNWSHAFRNAAAYFEFGDDVYSGGGDPMPALYTLFSHAQTRRFRERMPHEANQSFEDLVASQFFDIQWEDDAAAA